MKKTPFAGDFALKDQIRRAAISMKGTNAAAAESFLQERDLRELCV